MSSGHLCGDYTFHLVLLYYVPNPLSRKKMRGCCIFDINFHTLVRNDAFCRVKCTIGRIRFTFDALMSLAPGGIFIRNMNIELYSDSLV